MKKLVSLLSFVLLFSTLSFASASDYRVSDNEIDALFSAATEVSMFSVMDQNTQALPDLALPTIETDDSTDAVIAWVICWVVGGFGIHRHYLGTKPSMWAIYTFTCGGIFGIVPFVDFWVLLINGIINKDLGKYRDNENFFMWGS